MKLHKRVLEGVGATATAVSAMRWRWDTTAVQQGDQISKSVNPTATSRSCAEEIVSCTETGEEVLSRRIGFLGPSLPFQSCTAYTPGKMSSRVVRTIAHASMSTRYSLSYQLRGEEAAGQAAGLARPVVMAAVGAGHTSRRLSITTCDSNSNVVVFLNRLRVYGCVWLSFFP